MGSLGEMTADVNAYVNTLVNDDANEIAALLGLPSPAAAGEVASSTGGPPSESNDLGAPDETMPGVWATPFNGSPTASNGGADEMRSEAAKRAKLQRDRAKEKNRQQARSRPGTRLAACAAPHAVHATPSPHSTRR